EDQEQVDLESADGVDQAAEVLVRTLGRDGQDDRSLSEPELLTHLGRRQRFVGLGYAGPEWCDVDAARFDTEEFDDVPLRGLGIGQHDARAAGGQRHEQRNTNVQTPRRFREALVDHVVDRRHLRHARERRRGVERVVQQVDPGATGRPWEKRLLGRHAPHPAARSHGQPDDGDIARPRLFQQRGVGLAADEERQPEIGARPYQGGGESADIRLAPAGLAGNEVEHVQADVQTHRPYTRRTVSSELSNDSRSRLRRNHSAVERRSSGPAACTRRIASASSSGSADSATTPFLPSSTSSSAALSGPLTTTVGVPSAAASTTTSPYPSRREGKRWQRARRSVSRTSSAGAKPGALTEPSSPCSSIRRRTVSRSGPSPKISARRPGIRVRARATAGTTAGACFSGICRPAKTTSGSAATGAGSSRGSTDSPSTRVILPRLPTSSSRRACSREKHRASWRPRAANRWPSQPSRPATPPKYSSQYSPVQTSNQSTTTVKRRPSRAASTASSEKWSP